MLFKGNRDLIKLTVSNGVNNLVAALTGFLVARVVDAASFGVYSASINIMMSIAAVADRGVSVSLVRFVNRPENTGDRQKFVNAGAALKLRASALVCVLAVPFGLCLQFALSNERFPLPVLCLACAGAAVLNLWTYVRAQQQAEQNYEAYSNITLRYAFARMSALAAVLAFGVSDVAAYMFAIYLVAPLIAVPISIFRVIALAKSSNETAVNQKLLQYGRPIMVSALLYPLVYSIPQFFLLRIGLPGDAGVYGIGLMFAALLQPLNDALRSYFIPKVAAFASHDDARVHMIRVLTKVPMIALTLAFVMFGAEVVYAYCFESKYPGGMGVIAVLLVASVIAVMGGIANSVMHAIGIPELDMRANFVRIVVVISAAYVLIPSMGPFGGALSTLLAIVVGELFVTFFVIRRLTNFP